MPFGFRKKGEEEQQPIVTNVKDKEEFRRN
jgi:hypothetical protein